MNTASFCLIIKEVLFFFFDLNVFKFIEIEKCTREQ